MTNRITKKDLEKKLEYTNSELEKCNKEIRIGERYGYIALDFAKKGDSGVLKTLKAGLTKAQAFEYLDTYNQGMAQKEECLKKKKE